MPHCFTNLILNIFYALMWNISLLKQNKFNKYKFMIIYNKWKKYIHNDFSGYFVMEFVIDNVTDIFICYIHYYRHCQLLKTMLYILSSVTHFVTDIFNSYRHCYIHFQLLKTLLQIMSTLQILLQKLSIITDFVTCTVNCYRLCYRNFIFFTDTHT